MIRLVLAMRRPGPDGDAEGLGARVRGVPFLVDARTRPPDRRRPIADTSSGESGGRGGRRSRISWASGRGSERVARPSRPSRFNGAVLDLA